jgi:ABC-type transport system involved in multi-copper enzyme maturation permease subunit
MSRISAIEALVRFTLRRLASPGRLLVTLSIFAFPVAVAAGYLQTSRRVDLVVGGVVVYLNLYVVLIASSLFNSLAVTSLEMEDGSALLVYGGVVPRWAVLLTRYAIVVVYLSACSALSLAGIFALAGPYGLKLTWNDGLVFLGTSVAGLSTLTAAFLACGSWFRHSMAASLTLTVLWEVIVFGFPTQLWPYTVTNSLRGIVRSEVYGGDPPLWLMRVSDINERRGIFLLSTGEALAFLAIVTAAALLLAVWAISRRQLSDSASQDVA